MVPRYRGPWRWPGEQQQELGRGWWWFACYRNPPETTLKRQRSKHPGQEGPGGPVTLLSPRDPAPQALRPVGSSDQHAEAGPGPPGRGEGPTRSPGPGACACDLGMSQRGPEAGRAWPGGAHVGGAG